MPTVEMNPKGFADWGDLFALLRTGFAYMDPLISPPSSLTRMTEADFIQKAKAEDFFVIQAKGDILACLFGQKKSQVYYLGKLAVAPSAQRTGMARQLIEAAVGRGRALGCDRLQLQTRVELTANHAVFQRLGFCQVGATCHPGFDRPTSLTFERRLNAG